MFCGIDRKVVLFLKERLAALEESRKKLLEESVEYSTSLKEEMKSVNFGNYGSIDGISRRIDALRETAKHCAMESERSSIKLEISSLERERGMIGQMKKRMDHINELKDKKKECYMHMKEIQKELNELDEAISTAEVVILNSESNVELYPDEVYKLYLPMENTRFIQLRRNYRQIFHEIEKEQLVRLSYCRYKPCCLIVGREENCKEMKSVVEDFVSFSITSVSVTSLQQSILLAKHGKYMAALQKQSHALLRLNRESHEIAVEGGKHGVARVQEELEKLVKTTTVVEVKKDVLARFCRNNRSVWKEMIKECEGFIDLAYKEGQITIYGSNEDREKSETYLNKEIEAYATVSVSIALESTSYIAYLIKECKANQVVATQYYCNTQFSTRNEEPAVVLSGCVNDIIRSREWLASQYILYNKTHRHFSISSYQIMYLLRDNGSIIASLKSNYAVTVFVDKERKTILIEGKEEDCDACEKEVCSLLQLFVKQNYTINEYVRGRVLGKGGKHLQEWREKYKCSLSFENGILTAEGEEAHVRECGKEIEQWIEENTVMTIEEEASIVGPCIIGERGKKVKEYERLFGVRITQELESNRGRVVLIGNQEALNRCIESMQRSISDYKKMHKVISVPSAIMKNCFGDVINVVKEWRKEYSACTIGVRRDMNCIECEGREEIVLQLQEVIISHFQQYSEFVEEVMEMPMNRMGWIAGKQGSQVKELEEVYHVLIRMKKEENTILLCGKQESIRQVQKKINEIIEEKEIITREMEITVTELACLLMDGGYYVKNIERLFHATITLPDIHQKQKTLTISGNAKSVTNSVQCIQETFRSHYHYVFAFPEDAMCAVQKEKAIEVDSIQIETQTRLLIRSRGIVEILGNYENVHQAYRRLFLLLEEFSSTRFLHLPMNEGVCLGLKKKEYRSVIEAENGGISVYVDSCEQLIYIYGNTREVRKKMKEIQARIEELDGLFVVLPVNPVVLPFVIGSGGKIIKQLKKASQCQIEVLSSNNRILIQGDREHVRLAVSSIQSKITQFSEKNSIIRCNRSVIARIRKEYMGLVNAWKVSFDGSYYLDDANEFIRLKSESLSNLHEFRISFENLIEMIELGEEKEKEKEENTRSEEISEEFPSDISSIDETVDSDDRELIQSLLGVTI